jgi:hypothetical protein
MFLMIGVLIMSLGLMLVFHLTFFKIVPKVISYIIVLLIGFGLIFTLNVHGIWLGMMIIITGMLWIKLFIHRNGWNV